MLPKGVPKKRKIEDEGRVFKEVWGIQYFVTENNNHTISCLICSKQITICKEYNVKRHHESHREIYDKLNNEARKQKFSELKSALDKQKKLFTSGCKDVDNAVKTSYILSNLIAKKSKSYSDGEFIKDCILLSAEILCPKQLSSFKNISLSRNTISNRIRDMAGDLREQLKVDSKNYYAYSLALDESTDRSNICMMI